MSIKHRLATFNILVGLLALAVTLATTIAVKSVLAQNSTNQQQASSVGNNGSSSNNTSSNSITSTGSGTKVSISEEASEMGDQAYDPNPVKVKVGDTVTWTNDDSQAHTVTSGTDSSDPNMGKAFDSSPGLNTLLSTAQTFSHKFTTAGEFPYFCQLHPTMVGKVVVVVS
jgi:plastocyanin